MNVGTRLLLSAALAVGSTVGAAALGQTVVRDAQAEVGPSTPTALPVSATPPAKGGSADAASTEALSSDAASTEAVAEVARTEEGMSGASLTDIVSADTEFADTALAGAASPDASADGSGSGASGDADAHVRAAGVHAELAAAAEAGEISWDAAHRVSEELGGYIRGDRSLGEIPTTVA